MAVNLRGNTAHGTYEFAYFKTVGTRTKRVRVRAILYHKNHPAHVVKTFVGHMVFVNGQREVVDDEDIERTG